MAPFVIGKSLGSRARTPLPAAAFLPRSLPLSLPRPNPAARPGLVKFPSYAVHRIRISLSRQGKRLFARLSLGTKDRSANGNLHQFLSRPAPFDRPLRNRETLLQRLNLLGRSSAGAVPRTITLRSLVTRF